MIHVPMQRETVPKVKPKTNEFSAKSALLITKYEGKVRRFVDTK